MGKWGNESAALVGFEITVPAPASDEREHQASEQGPGHEDTWYRTLRVMSGSPETAGVERTGALGEGPRSQSEPDPEAPAKQPVPSTAPAQAPATVSQPTARDASETDYVAPQKSADSYEDSWYQILRSRRAAGAD